MTFSQYEKRIKRPGANQAWSPDWFYDTHIVSYYRKGGAWISVTLNTSETSRQSDQRINRLLADSPMYSVDVKIVQETGTTILIDSNGDGILEHAYRESELKAESGENSTQLKTMQHQYLLILQKISIGISTGQVFQ